MRTQTVSPAARHSFSSGSDLGRWPLGHRHATLEHEKDRSQRQLQPSQQGKAMLRSRDQAEVQKPSIDNLRKERGAAEAPAVSTALSL